MNPETLERLMHFDPATIIVVAIGIGVIYNQFRSSVKWHGQWIKQHDIDCREHKKDLSEILANLQKNLSVSTAILDSHHADIERLKNWRDKQ